MRMIQICLFIFCISFIMIGCGNEVIITETDISGDWETIKGDYEYIILNISKDGNDFSAYLHDRLINSGTWKLEKNTLTILLDNGHKNVYTPVILQNDILDLGNGKEQYRRPLSNDEKVLDYISQMIKDTGLEFSKPEQCTFAWNTELGMKQQVNGYKISTFLIMKNDFSDLVPANKSIAQFFKNNEFTESDRNVTETYSAWEEGIIKVIVNSANAEAEPGDTLTIEVLVGCLGN